MFYVAFIINVQQIYYIRRKKIVPLLLSVSSVNVMNEFRLIFASMNVQTCARVNMTPVDCNPHHDFHP